MTEKKDTVPTTNADFDKQYGSILHWVWRDVRVAGEIKQLVKRHKPQSSLELGCGAGLFSTFVGKQGVRATGVDFSKVAIEKANQRRKDGANDPEFIVGDVTDLKMLTEPFDVAFDVGCFHCLREDGQRKYALELHRLLNPGSVLLIWALNHSPTDTMLDADYMVDIFRGGFQLIDSKHSRRRIVGSRWYWFKRSQGNL